MCIAWTDKKLEKKNQTNKDALIHIHYKPLEKHIFQHAFVCQRSVQRKLLFWHTFLRQQIIGKDDTSDEYQHLKV